MGVQVNELVSLSLKYELFYDQPFDLFPFSAVKIEQLKHI